LKGGRFSKLAGVEEAEGSVFGVYGGVNCEDVLERLLLLLLLLHC
jgi:hypothetical protein